MFYVIPRPFLWLTLLYCLSKTTFVGIWLFEELALRIIWKRVSILHSYFFIIVHKNLNKLSNNQYFAILLLSLHFAFAAFESINIFLNRFPTASCNIDYIPLYYKKQFIYKFNAKACFFYDILIYIYILFQEFHPIKSYIVTFHFLYIVQSFCNFD